MMDGVTSAIENLYTLAGEVGVLTSYYDWKGRHLHAKPEVLLQVLRHLGFAIDRAEQAPEVLYAHHRAQWQTLVQPCVVAWDSADFTLHLRVPAAMDGPFVLRMVLESGRTWERQGRLRDLELVDTAEFDGARYALYGVTLPAGEMGYHRVFVQAGELSGECFVIAAPTTGYRMSARKRWGVFAPLYAVHGRDSGGAGDLGDLTRLARWTYDLGGEFVGTLPLLASFLTEPFEPSPYSPVSRMFWNELYLDLATAPGLDMCEPARRIMESANFVAEARALRGLELVDYRGQMAHRRVVIEALAASAWGTDGLRDQIEAYARSHPRADDYARFRAATEAQGRVWMDWPERMRDGVLKDGDFAEEVRRYHLYAQYAMDAQISRMDEPDTSSLYLDLPVGVNRGGYDVWRDRDAFVLQASAGAPPDPLFTDGQNWGLPPLHPHRMRELGYGYFIDCIRHHVEHAGLLRFDHVMGVHRLYWIPEGVDTKDGIYVFYPAGEMYAIISMESHRHECAVIGEDLGTVPDYVRPSMRHHGLSRLYVAQFNLPGGDRPAIEPPPAESVASLNTHDTPTFHGYWDGSDIDDFLQLGALSPDEAEAERQARARTCQATATFLKKRGLVQSDDISEKNLANIMRGLLEYLAASDAEMMMVNLEDLWLESAPHNVPGTSDERPNWRRKMDRGLDEITADEAVTGFLRKLGSLRKQRR